MIKLAGMAYSDKEVFRALCTLIERHGNDALISQAMIADVIGDAPILTVKKSLERLRTSGKIAGNFTPGIGYRYRICDAQPN